MKVACGLELGSKKLNIMEMLIAEFHVIIVDIMQGCGDKELLKMVQTELVLEIEEKTS